jgi:catechol 2,3-dioxygenase-like lactoylglutathione lyase family enzyme
MMSADAKHASERALITGTEAQLFVADVAASCAYYRDKLGFTVNFIYGEPPFYAQVARDNARLNLRHVDEPVFIAGMRERQGLLSATLTLASAAAAGHLFAAYEAAGTIFAQPLRKEEWGATTFIIKDPDGNLILFAGPAE